MRLLLDGKYFPHLFITDQPTAKVIPGNVTVNQSDAITLTCLTSGNPAPNVTWTTEGRHSVILSAGNKHELVITGKKKQGRYRCTVTNEIGLPDKSTAYVFVKRVSFFTTGFTVCMLSSEEDYNIQ